MSLQIPMKRKIFVVFLLAILNFLENQKTLFMQTSLGFPFFFPSKLQTSLGFLYAKLRIKGFAFYLVDNERDGRRAFW